MSYPKVIAQRCIACHTEGSPNGHIPFDNPEELKKMPAIGKSSNNGEKFIDQLQRALSKEKNDGPKMPPSGPPLTKEEINEIIQWAKGEHK
jgi:hypothetical protein